MAVAENLMNYEINEFEGRGALLAFSFLPGPEFAMLGPVKLISSTSKAALENQIISIRTN